MTCSCAPALLVARDELNVLFPKRDKSSDGCCGDAAHAARKSDHNPVNGFAHAYDFDEDVAEGLGTAELTNLRALFLTDPRTKYVIYEGRVAYPDGTDKPYTGSNPHDHHLHLSILDGCTHDTEPWDIARAFQGDDMNADQDARLLEVWQLLKDEGPLNSAIARIDANSAIAAGKAPDKETLGKLTKADLEAIGDAVADEIKARL